MEQRHKAREIALQGLYMHESVGTPLESLLRLNWDIAEIDEDDEGGSEKKILTSLNDVDDLTVREGIAAFARELIQGTLENLDSIDTFIGDYSKNWDFARIDVIDKSILRLSIFSLLHQKDIPPAVTIDEAIELGKRYGGENSGQFINGILDQIRKDQL